MGGKMPVVKVEPPRPLAAALRPSSVDGVVGQGHLLGPGMPLRLMVDGGNIKSLILWGPAGVGKTTLARAMANDSGADFYALDATSSGVKELRVLIKGAFHSWEKHNRLTLIFVDEVHRWNKGQQDVLLPAVENGVIRLIGATTEKPQFSVNSTLLSRMLVFEVKPLSHQEMVAMLLRVQDYYAARGVSVAFDRAGTVKALISRCSGDARKLVTVLEMLVEVIAPSAGKPIDTEMVLAVMPSKNIYFDAAGGDHFDLASAWQNSVQNSDADQAIYYLALWLASGEDPVYVARRVLVTAFEDAGDNPAAISSAVGAVMMAERVGMPECSMALSHATILAAQSPRTKTAYLAINRALADVNNGEIIRVPEPMRAGTGQYVRVITKKYVDRTIGS